MAGSHHDDSQGGWRRPGTGATSGLGRAVALRFAAAGADVALVGRSEADLERAAAEVTAHGVRAIPLRVDLALTSSLSDVVDRAIAELGVIGVLVNAAGTDAPGPAEEVTLEDWDRVIAVTLTAPFALLEP